MADIQKTLWDADPHTIAKHAILRGYLQRWMPIITARFARESRNIQYVDAFAGPGEYVNNADGSPIVAIRSAIEHQRDFPVPVRMTFIEKRKDRSDHLSELLRSRFSGQRRNVIIDEPICADCNAAMRHLMPTPGSHSKAFGPALVFLDQFGYGEVPMSLIRDVMAYESCEVFTYLNYSHLARFLSDSGKHDTIDSAWGGTEWQGAIGLAGAEREQYLLDSYKRNLVKRANVEYVCHFSMHDKHGMLLYWLFFCSGSLRGLEAMKESMWKVDETGQFFFSDRHAGQPALLRSFDTEWLARTLHQEFAMTTQSVADVRRYVLMETPRYAYKQSLALLEKRGEIVALGAKPGRRKGEFADTDMRIRFEPLGIFGPGL